MYVSIHSYNTNTYDIYSWACLTHCFLLSMFFFNLHYDKKTNAIAKSLKTFINIDSSMIRWFSFANLSNFEID